MSNDNPARHFKETGKARTPAQRKQAQRERDMTAIFESESDTWTEAQCMLVLGSARFPKGSPLQKAAWRRLGQIRGFV
ncbi:MAG: hypothetical protein HKL98_12160 [Burkholderiales bacterium]|nr:hypothetical protein [Burkholderiales bacterium]